MFILKRKNLLKLRLKLPSIRWAHKPEYSLNSSLKTNRIHKPQLGTCLYVNQCGSRRFLLPGPNTKLDFEVPAYVASVSGTINDKNGFQVAGWAFWLKISDVKWPRSWRSRYTTISSLAEIRTSGCPFGLSSPRPTTRSCAKASGTCTSLHPSWSKQPMTPQKTARFFRWVFQIFCSLLLDGSTVISVGSGGPHRRARKEICDCGLSGRRNLHPEEQPVVSLVPDCVESGMPDENPQGYHQDLLEGTHLYNI